MNTDIALKYATNLIGTKYEWWVGDNTTLVEEPFWASHNKVPDTQYVKNKSCNCAGLINLMVRSVGAKIPYLDEQYKYAGGTWAYYDYFLHQNKLLEFNFKECYPVGTLLLRKYTDHIDQGHLAVIYENDGINTKIIHSYSSVPYTNHEKLTNPGVTIEPLIDSVNWSNDGYYQYAILPDEWLK
jgi:hypothetical protein